MFIQVKAIRKGTKPPRWRRAYLPLHITFTQLAYILEVMLELPCTNQFEFEFYQEKDRLIEPEKGEITPKCYEYSYWNAAKSCVDDWLMVKTWFTFRLRGQKTQPEYRVECEKLLDDIRLDSESLSYPVILKEVSVEDDPCWSDGTVINQLLKDTCFIIEEKPVYPSFSNVEKRVMGKHGFGTNRDIRSRENLLSRSTSSLLEEAGQLLLQTVSSKTASKSVIWNSDSTSSQNIRKTGRLLDLLKTYRKEDLKNAAEETGCKLKASDKAKMALELSRHLLNPEVMKTLLLRLTVEELDAFEVAIRRKKFPPTEKEWETLAYVYDLNYLAEFTDDSVEVPWDVAQIYDQICEDGYRTFHEDSRWLIECLSVFSVIICVGPINHLFRMYKQREGSQTGYKEFMNVLRWIPKEYNPCRLIGTKIVAKEALEGDAYLAVEALQREAPYYLPGEREIRELVRKGYPASNPTYKKLYEFYLKDAGQEALVCEKLCRSAFHIFSSDEMLSDYMDEVNNAGIRLSSKKLAERFVGIVTDLSNHTRKYILKGHTPLEMHNYMPALPSDKPVTIVPMSSMAAEMLEEGRDDLAKKGFQVDAEMTADTIPVAAVSDIRKGVVKTGLKKIYPNDPCPCGSGKKYKKCCGRMK